MADLDGRNRCSEETAGTKEENKQYVEEAHDFQCREEEDRSPSYCDCFARNHVARSSIPQEVNP